MVDVPASTATTINLSLGNTTNPGTYAGRLERFGDRDWVRVNLVAGQTYNFTLRGGTTLNGGISGDGVFDPNMRLLDASGNQLAINEDATGIYERDSIIRFTATTTGDHYLDVGSIATSGRNIGDYVLSASVGNELPYATTTEIANYLTDGYWAANGGSRHRFATTTISVNISLLPADAQIVAQRALDMWANIGGLTFNYTTSFSAQIQIQSSGAGNTATTSYFATGNTTESAVISIGSGWLSQFGSGIYSYTQQIFMREIGHALGLGHAGNYEGTSTFSRAAGGSNHYLNDSWQMTTMSNMRPGVDTFVSGMSDTWVTGVMMADIVAMRNLYGGNAANAGNTTYGFNNTSGISTFDFTNYVQGAVGAFTINDTSGGADRIDASGYSANQLIDLRPGAFSNIGGMIGNIGISFNSIIEDARGGSGNDVIVGNQAANQLFGFGGDDVLMGMTGDDGLNGGSGYDTARFAFGLRAFFGLQRNANGSITSFGGSFEGTDQLLDIERLDFTDTNISVRPYFDFAGDFEADLLLRDRSSGAVTTWNLVDGAFVSSTQIGGMGANIQIVASGDFNADGFSDLLLRDLSSGAISDWTVRSGTFNSSVQLGGIGSNIQVITAGDFDRDGGSEILLRDTTSGAVTIWDISNGNEYVGSTQIGGVGGNIQIIGAADFNGDGTDDVLLRDTTSGSISFWRVLNNNFAASSQLGVVGSNVNVIGGFDFTGDGTADVLLHNTSTGAISYWEIENGAFVSSTQIGGIGSNFSIIGARDVDGNGFNDVLLRNNQTGGISAFGTNNGAYSQYFDIGGAPGSYIVI